MQPNLSFSLIVSLFLTCWLPVFCIKNNVLIKAYIHSASKKRKHLYTFVFRILTSNQFFAYSGYWMISLLIRSGYIYDSFINPIQNGPFGAAHGWGGGAKRSSLTEISKIYPAIMKLV